MVKSNNANYIQELYHEICNGKLSLSSKIQQSQRSTRKFVLFSVVSLVVVIITARTLFLTDKTIQGNLLLNLEANAANIDGNSNNPVSRSTTNGNACEGYKGILHIEEADEFAACGTAFFLHVINQIIYAEKYNLVPWVHLNNRSIHVYDDLVHGTQRQNISVTVAGVVKEGGGHLPGEPLFKNAKAGEITLYGNGVWNSYFQPAVSGVTEKTIQEDSTCASLPIVTIPSKMVFPGIHYKADWAVRAWPYRGWLKPKGQPLHEWYQPMRQRANEITQRYYKALPSLQEAIHEANPHDNANSKCLSIHIRLTDKGAGRKKNSLETFEPYAQAFVNSGMGNTLFIATDDARTIPTIQETWPQHMQSAQTLQVHFQKAAKRSSTSEATFLIAPHHRINTEALVDIYGMAKCDCIIHGASAMSEAAQYLNYPNLHECSVNLDDKGHISPEQFSEKLVAMQKKNRT